MSLNRTSSPKQSRGKVRQPKAGKRLGRSAKPLNQVTDFLNLQRAIAAPASASPETVLQLQRIAGNRAVERLLKNETTKSKLTTGPTNGKLAKLNSGQQSPRSTVQRLFGKKKKKKTPDDTNRTYQETGQVPTGQN